MVYNCKDILYDSVRSIFKDLIWKADFKQRAEKFEPAPSLGESPVVPYRTPHEAAALLPQLVKSLKTLKADYGELYNAHRKQHADLLDRVSLDLGGGEDRKKTSEELLATAVKERRLPNALMETMYDAGRYMYICSAGELPPNLQGIWTVSWIPAWSEGFGGLETTQEGG